MKKQAAVILLIFLVAGGLFSALFFLKSYSPDGKLINPISDSLSIFSFFKKKSKPKSIIYGYLPYWELEKIKFLQLDKLTDIAYFGVYLNEDGSFKKSISKETVEEEIDIDVGADTNILAETSEVLGDQKDESTSFDDKTESETTGEQKNELIEEPGLNNWRNSEDLKKLIEDSKKNNVRISLTVISHIDEISDKFLDCEKCWDNLYNNLVKELDYHGIKDVNLNFEYGVYVNGDRAEKYTNFVKFLNEKLDANYEDSFLVVSTFADSVKEERVTDIESLSKVADKIFIMGYDFYRPQSSNAGPVAPLTDDPNRSYYDLTTMINDYLTESPPNKIILGVPYYGYNWVIGDGNTDVLGAEDETNKPEGKNDEESVFESLADTPTEANDSNLGLESENSTVKNNGTDDQGEVLEASTKNEASIQAELTDQLNGSYYPPEVLYPERLENSDELGFSQAQTYDQIMSAIIELKPEIKWNQTAHSPFFTYTSPETGAIRQVYFENEQSLAKKYELIKDYDLAGVGIWALGYDGGYVELWNLLKQEFID